MKKPPKISKQSKKYNDLDYKQSKLKSSLHENWRNYYKWKTRKSQSDRTKPPFNMIELENQQKEINKIRKRIGKAPITLIRDFKTTLRHL